VSATAELGGYTEQQAAELRADAPLCRRGLHPMTADNAAPRGPGRSARCRACLADYRRARRAGLPWTRSRAPLPQPDGVHPTCLRGRHALVPDNVVPGTRTGCRACRTEYSRAVRAGETWDGPGRGRRCWPEALPPSELEALRAAVGACPDCGWTRDSGGPHRCPA
jgi:hypothetical protein